MTIGLTDTNDNPGSVSLTFPMVERGSQTLSDFAYDSPTATALQLVPPTLSAPTGAVSGSTLSYASGNTNICAVDATTGALTLLTAGDCVITVTASVTPNYNEATDTFTITLSEAPTLTVSLNANIAGNDIVNIAEQTAGFAITGTVDTTGATVEVTIGSGSARSATVTNTTWTVGIPGNALEITGTSVVVVATAMRADRNDGEARRTINVDVMAPTATYTPPVSLTVGTPITAIMPGTPSGDISTYTLSGTLPPGLGLDVTNGIISGTPTTANTNLATVTIGLTDTNDNPTDVPLTFPAVAMGSQTLADFVYSAANARVGQPVPTVTAPTGRQTGSNLSYASGNANVCTVNITTGALTLVAAGTCAITVTASATANYQAATARFTITVAPPFPIATLAGPLTEADLFASPAPTVTVTLENTEYAAPGTLMQNHFTVTTDDVAGTVSVSGVTRDSNTVATLTLAYSGEDITADGTLSVTLAAAGHTVTGPLPTNTIQITASTGVNVCGRTVEVRDEIVARSTASECTSIADLATITTLDFSRATKVSGAGITELQLGDFAGLTGLVDLLLLRNSLTTLPANIFADLSALEELNLFNNDLNILPVGAFAGLTSVLNLYINSNEFTSLPVGIFDGLDALDNLGLHSNPLFTPGTGLPAGIFDDVLDTLDPVTLGGSFGLAVDPVGRDAHFVCSRGDAVAIVAFTPPPALPAMPHCLRITSAQLTTFIDSAPPDSLPMFTESIAAQTYVAGVDIGAVTLPAATGGDGVLSYTISPPLPADLVLTGRILSGTPRAVSPSTEYRYRVIDSDIDSDRDTAELTFTITVRPQFTFGFGMDGEGRVPPPVMADTGRLILRINSSPLSATGNYSLSAFQLDGAISRPLTVMPATVASNDDVDVTFTGISTPTATNRVIEVRASAMTSNGDPIEGGFSTALVSNPLTIPSAASTLTASLAVSSSPLEVMSSLRIMPGPHALGLEITDIASIPSTVLGSAAPAGYTDANTGLFDFVISGIEPSSTVVRVLIPLLAEAPPGARLFKYDEGWSRFTSIIGADNYYDSRQSPCPGLNEAKGNDPGEWRDAQSGTQRGARCLLLEITDGGINDADGTVNGLVFDPSGLFTSRRSSSGGGGGAMHWSWLLLMFTGLLALRRPSSFPRKRQPSQ